MDGLYTEDAEAIFCHLIGDEGGGTAGYVWNGAGKGHCQKYYKDFKMSGNGRDDFPFGAKIL